MTDVIMPQMGESIAEGTITKWLKNVGDKVERDEPLFEISTDKVDAEIPAPAAGILKEIRVEAGATVAINTVVGVIAAEGTAVATAPSAPAASVPLPVPPPPAFSTPPVAMTAAAAPAVPPPVFSLEPPAAPLRAVPPPAATLPPRSREGPRRDDGGRATAEPFVARRAQDRSRAQRRHPRAPGHRHLGPGDQAGHPGSPRRSQPRARAGAGSSALRSLDAHPRAPACASRSSATRRRRGVAPSLDCCSSGSKPGTSTRSNGSCRPCAAPGLCARSLRGTGCGARSSCTSSGGRGPGGSRAHVAHPPQDSRAHGAEQAHLRPRGHRLRDRHDADRSAPPQVPQRLRGAQRDQSHLPSLHPQGHGRRPQGLPGAERQHRRRQRRSTGRTSTSASRSPSTGA